MLVVVTSNSALMGTPHMSKNFTMFKEILR